MGGFGVGNRVTRCVLTRKRRFRDRQGKFGFIHNNRICIGVKLCVCFKCEAPSRWG